jgi:spermidine synthase
LSTKPSSEDNPCVSEAGDVRYLHFSSQWVQGAMWVAKPNELVLEYTAQMMAWLLFLHPPKQQHLVLLGLGAGSLARFCLKHFQNNLTVVEWNPKVTAVCRAYFKLPAPKRLSIEHEDAGVWVKAANSSGLAAALMIDLYDSQARGPVRDSLEFYEKCYDVLAEVGVLSVNLFGAHESFARNIQNLSKAFNGRVLSLPQIDAGNQVVLAFKGPALEISIEQLLVRAQDVQSHYGLPARKWAKSLVAKSFDGVLRV